MRGCVGHGLASEIWLLVTRSQPHTHDRAFATRTCTCTHHRHPLQAANALTFDELQSLSYKEVKGTGLANVCPVVASDGAVDGKGLKSGNYKLERFCMEPTEFTVKEESQFKGGQAEFVPTKLMTRLTYSLDGMEGTFSVDGSGNVALVEKEGLDFAPVTVQLPGGERVPFLFTVKELNAKGKAEGFEGQFVVPAYRGSSFLDPKVRCTRDDAHGTNNTHAHM